MHSSQEMWHLLCVVVAEELGATDEERTDEVVVGKHQNDVIDKKHMWHLLSSIVEDYLQYELVVIGKSHERNDEPKL